MTSQEEKAPAHYLGSLRVAIGKVAAASAVALALGEIVSLVQTIALARLLSPAEVGYFAAGSVLTTFLGNFVEGGLRSGLVHREHGLADAAETVFRATLLAGFLMTLGALAAAPVIALVFHSHTAGLVAASMSGMVLLFSLTNVPEALLQREFSVRRRLIVGPSVGISFAVVSVTLAALGLGIWSMVAGSYASYAVWVVEVWWISGWRPGHGQASFRLWRELARFGFPLALGMFGDRVEKIGQAMVTGRMLGAEGLGLLRYGERMARIPVAALVEVSSISLFPAFARLGVHRERMQSAYLRALGMVTVGAAAVTALLIAVGEPLTVLVLGEKWRGAGVVLVSMACLGLGKAFITVGEEAIKGAGRTRLLNWYTATEVTLSLVLLVTLIRPFGLVGVGLSISLTGLAVGFLVTALARPVVGVTWRQVGRATVPALCAAAVGYAVVAPLEHQVVHSDAHGLLAGLGLVAAECVLFLAIYFGVLWTLAPLAVREVWTVVRSVLLRRRPGTQAGPVQVGDSGSLDAGRPNTDLADLEQPGVGDAL